MHSNKLLRLSESQKSTYSTMNQQAASSSYIRTNLIPSHSNW